MIQPGEYPLVMYAYTPTVLVLDFVGYNFTAATFRAQVREKPEGEILIDLTNAASNAEGVSATYAAAVMQYDAKGNEIGPAPVSSVQIRINETTIEGIVASFGATKDIDLVWDLHITGGGLPKTRWIEGPAIIRAGVTQ